MIEEKKNIRPAASREPVHNMIMENREKLTVSGVLDVESFDEDNVILHTEMGVLIVKGEDLHINKLSIDSGELMIEGEISSCTYTDQDGSKSKGMGFLGKMFR